MRSLLLVVLVGCGGSDSDSPVVDAPANDDSGGDGGLVSLDKTPTTYRETCDGSGALALSLSHFIDVNDENQGVRVYQRAMATAPSQILDISQALGLATTAEADLEDLARIGNRVFATTSHGRKASGNL